MLFVNLSLEFISLTSEVYKFTI